MVALTALLISAALLPVPSWQTEPLNGWDITLSAQGAGLVISADASACQVPETFPIHPGTTVSLENSEGNELATAHFLDPLQSGVPSQTPAQPGEACQLSARFKDIPRGNGYRLRIGPDSSDLTPSGGSGSDAAAELAVTLAFVTIDGMQVIDNADGTHDCIQDGQTAITPGAQLEWSPAFPPSDPRNADPWDGVFGSLVLSTPDVPVQLCSLAAGVRVPYAKSFTFTIGDAALETD